MSRAIRRRRLVALTVVLASVLVMVVLVALRPRPQRQRPPAIAPLVAVEVVAQAREPVTVTGWGTVRPRDAITLVPQVGGRVTAVAPNLRAGGFFAAGETLVQIETVDYELGVEQARSQVAQAEVGLALAREEAASALLEWRRTVRGGPDTDPQREVGEPGPLVLREPQLRQGEAQLAAARAALARAELDLARCTLAAPFAGRVQSASVSVGQVVRVGEILASLHDSGTAEITVSLPDRELAWIAVPMDADDPDGGAAAVVRARFAGAEHAWTGRAVRLGGSIDEASRQVPVVVEVPAPHGPDGSRPPLLDGMFVEVAFTSPAPPSAVTIARRSLRPGDQVWLLDQEDRLRIRPVTVARAGLETVVVTEGLEPGDRLVASSLQYVSDGMQLAPLPDADDGTGERP